MARLLKYGGVFKVTITSNMGYCIHFGIERSHTAAVVTAIKSDFKTHGFNRSITKIEVERLGRAAFALR